MKKLNFKSLSIYTDITRKSTKEVDARLDFANVMYTGCNGIVAHSLALRIYESEDEIELNEEEVNLILKVAEQGCAAIFWDSIKSLLEEQN